MMELTAQALENLSICNTCEYQEKTEVPVIFYGEDIGSQCTVCGCLTRKVLWRGCPKNKWQGLADGNSL
jgi:hypothetical protein